MLSRKRIIEVAGCAVAVIVAVLAAVRVPYFGEFLDAVIFTYPFGWLKWPLYLAFIYFCCQRIFSLSWHKRFMTKRFVIGGLLVVFGLSLLMSTVAWWVKGDNPLWAEDIFFRSYTETSDLWYTTSWPHRQVGEYFANWGGGLLGNFWFSIFGYASSIGAFVIASLMVLAGVSFFLFGSFIQIFRKIVLTRKYGTKKKPLVVEKEHVSQTSFAKANADKVSIFTKRQTAPVVAASSSAPVDIVAVAELPPPPEPLSPRIAEGKREAEAIEAALSPSTLIFADTQVAPPPAVEPVAPNVLADKPKTEEIPLSTPAEWEPTLFATTKPINWQPKEEEEHKPGKTKKLPEQREKWTGFKNYRKPSLSLLKEGAGADPKSVNAADAERKADSFNSFFSNFEIEAKVVGKVIGPRVTKFQIALAEGVRVAELSRLADDIRLALKAKNIRIEAPIPGTSLVGIEVPNDKIATIAFRDLVASLTDKDPPLTVALGKDTLNQIVRLDLAKAPHLLVAGSTGSGKSVCISSLITSLAMRNSPNEVRMALVDPKKVELQLFDRLPHLITPVVTDAKTAVTILTNLVGEMEDRYERFASLKVRNIDAYNLKAPSEDKMPYLVVIVDELADLMTQAKKAVEGAIQRLTQMARAAGIHLVLATQRPSVDVITGVIKANVPSRIAFAVASQVDSRTILDEVGAELLLGKGDMLYNPVGAPSPERVQGAFLSDDEIEAVVNECAASGEQKFDDSLLAPIPEDVPAKKPRPKKAEAEDEL